MKRIILPFVISVVLGCVLLCVLPMDNVQSGLFIAVLILALTVYTVGQLVWLWHAGRDEAPRRAVELADTLQAASDSLSRGKVRDTPPKNLPPRLIGAIARNESDFADVSATLMDLITRGYIMVTPAPQPGLTRFSVTPAPLNTLDPIERNLHQAIFRNGPSASVAELKQNQFFATELAWIQSLMADEFRAQKWYHANPAGYAKSVRNWGICTAILGPILLFIAAVVLHSLLSAPGGSSNAAGIMLLGFPCVVLGVGMAIVSKRLQTRTASGYAAAANAIRFKNYLETVNPAQLLSAVPPQSRNRFGGKSPAAGGDLFSRYLPYAVAFGCAAHWNQTFAQLRTSGAQVSIPEWIHGGVELTGTAFEVIDAASSAAEAAAGITNALAAIGAGVGAIGEIAGGIGEFIGGVGEVVGGIASIFDV